MDPITVNNAPRKLFLLPRIINYKQISCAISTINFNVLTFRRMQECDFAGDVVIKRTFDLMVALIFSSLRKNC